MFTSPSDLWSRLCMIQKLSERQGWIKRQTVFKTSSKMPKKLLSSKMYQAQKALAAVHRLQLTFHPFLNVSLRRARHLKNKSQFGDGDSASCIWFWQTPFFNDLLNSAFLTPRNPISSNHMREAIMSYQSGVKDLISPCDLSKSLKKQGAG